MSRALIRSASALAATALLAAAGVLPAAASVQTETITIPAPAQVSEVIPASEFVTAMLGGLDRGVAEAETQAGQPAMELSGIGLLVFGPALAVAMYEYEHAYSVAGN